MTIETQDYMMKRKEITAQFSPGQWVVETDHNGVVIGVSAPGEAKHDLDFVCSIDRAANPRNARLIAAAPDLLDCFLDIYLTIQASELPLPLRFKFLQTMEKIEPELQPEMAGG